MGKNIRGKELGQGISQRKDGYYIGRFTDKFGNRQQKLFKTLQECKKWLNDSIDYDIHTNLNVPLGVNLNNWFDYWIEIKRPKVRESTIKSYTSIYDYHIRDELGRLILSEIKPIQCQLVLNKMASKNYKSKYIKSAKELMFQLFEYAYKNDIIPRNPCKILEADIGQPSQSREALKIDEHKKFLIAIKNNFYEYAFRFVLQTGLRCGELMGLKWSDIDYENKVINISRSMNVRQEIGEPKSKAGYRSIPLTDEALNLLRLQREKNAHIKVLDLKTADFIFLNKNGIPINNVNYDTSLKRICKHYELTHISMHILRHTFATRCIEAGMKPKVLQTIMGHSDLGMTMNLYVHITEDEKRKEISDVSSYLFAIGT